ADLRAPTPTGAAVLATPDRADLRSELFGMQSRLGIAMLSLTGRTGQDLDALRQRLERASPARRIQSERQVIDDLQQRGLRAFRHALQLRRAHLVGLHSRLAALNPQAILQRGYALVQRPDGRLVRSASEVRSGDAVDVRLRDGTLSTRIQKVLPGDQPDPTSAKGA
ncbi:MAG: exodeoxyribonuclease VII large subunit, partial [Chloroflexi bacterium]